MKEPGDREGRPYISCGNIGSGNVGATLAALVLSKSFM